MNFKKLILASVILVFNYCGSGTAPRSLQESAGAPLVGPDLSSFEYEEVDFENGNLSGRHALCTAGGGAVSGGGDHPRVGQQPKEQ